MELPVYELTIDDFAEDRVEAIAFVDNPAIQRNWMAFANEKISFDFDDTLSTADGKAKAKEYISQGADIYIISARDSKEGMYSVADELGIDHSRIYATGSNFAKVEKVKELGITKHFDNNPDVVSQLEGIGVKFAFFKFNAVDTEKRIVAGPLMVAEMPIYRNYQGKEFFVKFSAKTIESIVDKFMQEGRITAFNYMHNEEQVISDVYLQQSFIIDSTKGINTPKGYETLADGSWFGFVKVNNDEIWNDFVKTGKLKGFSVEGNFSQKEQFNNQIMTKLEEMLDKLDKKLFGSQETPATEQKVFGSAKLTDGTEITWEGELAQGSPVMLADGSVAPDGQHTLEDGTVISIVGGVVESIAEPVETPEEVNMSAEIEALKLHVAELKSAIESMPKVEAPKDFSNEIEALKETNKELFEAMKVIIESKDDSNKKDAFKKSEKPLTKVDVMIERYKK